MRLFIGSDIHGASTALIKFFDIVDSKLEEDKDTKLVFLGDIYNHGPRNPLPEGYAPMKVAEILNNNMDRISVIKGNCDSEVDQMISKFEIQGDFNMDFAGRKLFFTHGHKANPDMPIKEAKPGDFVFYGHFHRPNVKVVDGVTYICVGSIGMNPAGVPKAFVEINEKELKLQTFDGEILENIKL